MEHKVPGVVRDAATIVVGSAIFALAFDWLFQPNQITALKQTVLALDPGAFLIVCDAHEVIGEGFAHYSADAL